jgi:DNA (cytosine-5)-methyltransferase 1
MPYYGSGSGETGRSLDRPLGTLTTRARWAAVDGDRMRMLASGECAAAMGFPADYRLLGNLKERHMQIGNAVCPPVMRAVVARMLEAA